MSCCTNIHFRSTHAEVAAERVASNSHICNRFPLFLPPLIPQFNPSSKGTAIAHEVSGSFGVILAFIYLLEDPPFTICLFIYRKIVMSFLEQAHVRPALGENWSMVASHFSVVFYSFSPFPANQYYSWLKQSFTNKNSLITSKVLQKDVLGLDRNITSGFNTSITHLHELSMFHINLSFFPYSDGATCKSCWAGELALYNRLRQGLKIDQSKKSQKVYDPQTQYCKIRLLGMIANFDFEFLRGYLF